MHSKEPLTLLPTSLIIATCTLAISISVRSWHILLAFRLCLTSEYRTDYRVYRSLDIFADCWERVWDAAERATMDHISVCTYSSKSRCLSPYIYSFSPKASSGMSARVYGQTS